MDSIEGDSTHYQRISSKLEFFRSAKCRREDRHSVEHIKGIPMALSTIMDDVLTAREQALTSQSAVSKTAREQAVTSQSAVSKTAIPPVSTSQSANPQTPHLQSTSRKPKGFVRLLGLSSVTMALVLPLGIYPRILQGQELEATHKKIQENVPVVSVIHPQAAPKTIKISLPGNIEAALETGIYARTNGYIRERFADIGDRVHAGQLLADIETPEVDESAKEAKALVLTNIATRAQSQANLDKAKADVDTAIADLAQAKSNLLQLQSNEKFAHNSMIRWGNLVKQGAVSNQDSDEKETLYKTSHAATQAGEDKIHSAQSQIIAARARLNASLADINVSDANIDAARARQNRSDTERGFNKVVAPFSGVITERNIDPGMLISSGSDTSKAALYRLARIDTVKVFVEVPQYASSAIRVGQSVAISLKEFPGRVFTGTIKRTAVALDATARTLRTEIHIANSDLTLAPGMYADVTFSVPRAAHTFLIPTNSLITRAEGPQIVIARGDSVAFRKVQLGDDLGKEVEVVGGVTAGDNVVMNPSDALRDGNKVVVESH
jgi:RND family efflux transporter MFP subunit